MIQKRYPQVGRKLTQNSPILIITVYILMQVINSQRPSQNFTILSCSTEYCQNCLNLFICSECIYDGSYCCSKYCTQCVNMNHCLECQFGFMLKSLSPNGSVICSRVHLATDPNFNLSSSECDSGYFAETNTNSCIGCNFEFCEICLSGYGTCQKCISGYYLGIVNSPSTPGSSICIACSNGCHSCTNQFLCTLCYPGYSLHNSSCIKCQDPYCSTCITTGQCTSNGCYSYAYFNYSCILCDTQVSNCSSCFFSHNQFDCSNCYQGFYLALNFNTSTYYCSPCQPNCIQCFMENNCQECVNEMFLNSSSQCQPCSIGCSFCFNLTNCSSCFPNYDLQLINGSLICSICGFPCLYCFVDVVISTEPFCSECYPGFYVSQISTTQNQCLYCNITNCVQCTSPTLCTVCEDGYFVALSPGNQAQICQKCPCRICISSNNTKTATYICLQCQPGNYISNGTCLPCNVQNCNFCSQQDLQSCQQCASGYMLFANNTFNITEPPYICKPCSIKNCKICNQTYFYNTTTTHYTIFYPFCLQCLQGFYLEDTIACSPCSKNCVACLNSSFCQACSEGFYLLQQQLIISQICQPCPPSCLYCTSQGCLTCAPGYYHQPRTAIEPNPIHQCYLCSLMPGCFQCSYQNWCQLCNLRGYAPLPNTQGLCMSCGDACTTCQQDLTCLSCEAGYQLITQTNQCMDVTGWPIWAIFTLSTLGFTVAFVIFQKIFRTFAECLSKKHQNHSCKISGDETERNQPVIQMEEKSVNKQQKEQSNE